MEPQQKFHLKTLVAIVSQFVSLIYNYRYMHQKCMYKDFFCVNKMCVLRRARQRKVTRARDKQKNRWNILLYISSSVPRREMDMVFFSVVYTNENVRTRTNKTEASLLEPHRTLCWSIIYHMVLCDATIERRRKKTRYTFKEFNYILLLFSTFRHG